MKFQLIKLKAFFLFLFVVLAVYLLIDNNLIIRNIDASANGPVAGNSGAPGETTCTNCHIPNSGNGVFTILNAPASYALGQTYQITVRHQTADTTRKRWGFQMTALAGITPASNFANLTANTQIINGANGRRYIEHTPQGTYATQTGGAIWNISWTAPTTNIGAVTLYAAGNQANNDGTENGDQIYTATKVIQPPAAPTPPALFDFDGDRKSDVSVFRPTDGGWYLQNSSTGFYAVAFGANGDKVVPADFSGDGKTDVAIFRPSDNTWYVFNTVDNTFYGIPFGTTGDVPVPEDFDGDGKADINVFRPSTGFWFRNNSSNGQFVATPFGQLGDVPTVGDFDGDSKADIAVFRQTDGGWYRLNSSNDSFFAVAFGQTGDKVVPADYTGDGKTDIAVYRGGTWYILRSEDLTFYGIPFGLATDIPSAGDFDGDGKADQAVYRGGQWFIQQSTSGFLSVPFGLSSDIPIESAFVY